MCYSISCWPHTGSLSQLAQLIVCQEAGSVPEQQRTLARRWYHVIHRLSHLNSTNSDTAESGDFIHLFIKNLSFNSTNAQLCCQRPKGYNSYHAKHFTGVTFTILGMLDLQGELITAAALVLMSDQVTAVLWRRQESC